MTISSTVNETTVTVNGTGSYTVTVSGTDSLYRPIHTLRNKTVIIGKIHINVHIHHVQKLKVMHLKQEG